MEQNKKLTNRQVMAISYIISSPTLEEARRKVKVSKGTLYAWLKEEAFKAELKRQRDEVVKEASDRLKCAMGKAVDELIKLLDSPKPGLRRLTCRDILDYASRAIELEDIEQRLGRIEQAISERGNK